MNVTGVPCYCCRREVAEGKAWVVRAWIADTLYRTEFVCVECWQKVAREREVLLVRDDVEYRLEALSPAVAAGLRPG